MKSYIQIESHFDHPDRSKYFGFSLIFDIMHVVEKGLGFIKAHSLNGAGSQDVAGSSVVVRIFDPLEHLSLCPPLDHLHSEHLVEGILHSLAMWPGFPQLKHESSFLLRLGVLALPLPLVNASISASLSSSVKVSRALTSIASGSQCLEDDPAIPRNRVSCRFWPMFCILVR